MPQEPSLASLSLYAAGVLCVLGLFGLMRPSRLPFRTGATLVGLAGLAWLFVQAIAAGGGPDGPPVNASFCVAFGTIAVAAAVRMITHPRPVFAALYFILVVLASAALFLMMQAEFMAFALIIVYAGAILITYMFVLMLAQPSPEGGGGRPHGEAYDRIPREPAAAATVGFFMLMVLSEALIGPNGPMPPSMPGEVLVAEDRRWDAMARMPGLVLESAKAQLPAASRVLPWDDGRYLVLRDGRRLARVELADGAGVAEFEVPDDDALTNTRAVGMSLVADFPVSLELAGVILLMAMFGAVVLARRQIELGEDERRESAGLRRLSAEDPDDDRRGAARTGGGA